MLAQAIMRLGHALAIGSMRAGNLTTWVDRGLYALNQAGEWLYDVGDRRREFAELQSALVPQACRFPTAAQLEHLRARVQRYEARS